MTSQHTSLIFSPVISCITVRIFYFLFAICTCNSLRDRQMETSVDFARHECLRLCNRIPKRDEKCLKNCISKLHQPSFGSMKRAKRAIVYRNFQRCPLETITTKFHVGNITNVKIVFTPQNVQDHVKWIANISWNVFFANSSLYDSDLWQGFLVYWKPIGKTIPLVGDPNCVFSQKNSTWTLIESGNKSGWSYPDAIETYVMFYPSHEEDDYFVTMKSFHPTATAAPILTTSRPGLLLSHYAAIGIGSLTGVIFLAIAVVLYKRKGKTRWISQTNGEAEYEYDASILFSSRNANFVRETLLPFLEVENTFKCHLHYRDWEPGETLEGNMASSVYKCRKVIVVMSKFFLKSNYCQNELSMALGRVHTDGDSSLIVINLDGVPLTSLPPALRGRTFLDLTNNDEINTWKVRLQRKLEEEAQNNRPYA